MERYAMYLRKSRADLDAEAHGEGETLSRHKAALLTLAKRLNLVVSEIYQEIVSGETIAARPMMQQLLQEVSEGSPRRCPGETDTKREPHRDGGTQGKIFPSRIHPPVSARPSSPAATTSGRTAQARNGK